MRIRFIFTLCSDRVPAISLVGSAGGIRTTGAAPGWGRGGIGGGGGRDAIGAVGTGGGGGGEVGMGGGAGGGGRGCWFRGSGRWFGLLGRWGGIAAPCAHLDLHQHLPWRHGCAIFNDKFLNHTRYRRGNWDAGFVCFNLAEHLVNGNRVTHSFLPPDISLADAVGEGWAGDLLEVPQHPAAVQGGLRHHQYAKLILDKWVFVLFVQEETPAAGCLALGEGPLQGRGKGPEAPKSVPRG